MNNDWLIHKLDKSCSSYPQDIFSKKCSINTCVNPYSYHILRRNRQLFSQFDGIFVDGILLCIFLRIIWGKRIRRLSFDMTSMAKDLFQHALTNGKTIYFIGSSQEKLEKTINIISESYPSLTIVGYRNGYFKSVDERSRAIENIKSINPDYVIIGMGSPLQEEFAYSLKTNGYKGCSFTCGGFIHQTSDGLNYYPHWVDKYNLRGFYRQYKEKIFLRNYNTLIQFPILFIIDTLKTKLNNFLLYGNKRIH